MGVQSFDGKPYFLKSLGPRRPERGEEIKVQKYQVVITGSGEVVKKAAQYISKDMAKYVIFSEMVALHKFEVDQFNALMGKKQDIAKQTNVIIDYNRGEV